MARSVKVDALIHEMRNELAVARANLEGIVDGKFAPTTERLLGIIQALEQLDVLIEGLRVESPDVAMSARASPINVCELLNREYGSIVPMAMAKNVKVEVRRCSTTSPECAQFYADPTRVGQITKNVLLNAIRYTPQGGTVTIDCSRGGNQLEVRISDSGPGVAKEEAQAVFASGYRGSASDGTAGSGFGLAIVKQLVEAEGGTVTVAGSDKHGALFTIRLPGVAPEST
jgi:two-component system, OmpR family, sensor histidine kinase BaeS